MVILKLTVEGFKPFRKRQTYTFSGKAGFYLLSGDNQVDVALQGNGAGKSAFLDALCWCLYGKTARGTKASSVVSWGRTGKPGALVSVNVGKGEAIYTVSRTQAPNGLRILGPDADDSPIEQDQLDQLLGMNYACFLNSVLMGQFNSFFFDLTPTEKLNLFSEILDLDLWQDRAEKAKKQAGILGQQETEMDRELATEEGRWDVMRETIVDLERQVTAWEATTKADKKRVEEYRDTLQEQQADAKTKVAGIERQIETRTAKADPEGSALLASIREDEQVLAAARNTYSMLQKQLHAAKADRKTLERDLSDGVCPLCRQKISVQHADDELRRADETINRLTEELKAAEKAGARLAKSLKDQQAKLVSIKAADQDNQLKVRGLTDKLNAAKSELRVIGSQLAEANRKLTAKAECPHLAALGRCRQTMREAADNIKSVKEDLADVRADKAAHEWWASGFKDLRLWIVDQTLRELEVEVNNSIEQLGLRGWAVRFDVERETKGGSVSKGFSVFIRSPEVQEEVPWDSWSGGEGQRLRIASAIGLANLIRTRRGVQAKQEFWDEPTAHLSEQGVDDLLAWFKTRADAEGRQVWLVDHRSLSYGGFDGRVCITKKRSGSTIETA